MRSRFGVIGIVLAVVACSAASPPPARQTAEPVAGALGMQRETAIEVCRPVGERAYLDRLRCADGRAASYSRAGSYGMRTPTRNAAEEKIASEQMFGEKPVRPGQADYHVVDMYEVKCSDRTFEVYLDMYHCDKPPPQAAPPGLTYVP